MLFRSILTDIMYDIPSDPTVQRVVITEACAKGECGPTLVHRGEGETVANPAS